VNAYTRIAEKPTIACIVLHEHLGLVKNIVQTSEFLMSNKISVMIPDLFLSVTAKTLLNNEFDAIKKLKLSRVTEAVELCLKELRKNHERVILMGFSVGSAYGFKILQRFPEAFAAAFLFYGAPSFANWGCSEIKTTVIAFHGADDRIKYLSDSATYE
jgi:dienelactone hydrolase